MESTNLQFDAEYELITFDESLCLTNYYHAAHCCIYSPNSFPTVESCESAAYISMQMRFDGHIGFPGGIIEDINIVSGLNRELLEEINLDKKYFTTKENHCFSHISKESNWCYHFFAKEVSVEDFQEIEKKALNAEDYGKEVLGLLRVPLVIMEDGTRGFPAFLSNSFAGCAKYQLLQFLLNHKLMSYDVIKECLSKSQL